MSHLVPHARQHDRSDASSQNAYLRPSSSYNPAPPSAPPSVPPRPSSAYIAPPVYQSSSSRPTSSLPVPRPYSQPPIEQFNHLSLNNQAARPTSDHRSYAGIASEDGGGAGWQGKEQRRYQLTDGPGVGSASSTLSGNVQPPLHHPQPTRHPQPIPPTPIITQLPQYSASTPPVASMTLPARQPAISSIPNGGSGPPLVAFFPSVESLKAALPHLDGKTEFDRLLFSQDVLRVLDRHLYPNGSPTDFLSPETMPSAARLPVELENLLNVAIPVIISFTSHPSVQISALASYLRGKLLASGACPDFLPRDQRQAFKDFEVAARSGEARGWFRLGRDYEGVGDLGRARECFERGRSKGDCESTYRMGMANLLGQLHLSPDPTAALPLLRAASEQTTPDFPQPSYVYGMLLAGELSTPAPIPHTLLLPPTSPPSDALHSQHQTAREAVERAAHFGLAPAQYKLGYLYEHASLGMMYDPLMSVQWYSLASQGGEIEADMALSKWFLCGAEGHFGKNEDLARTFAEKAARRGHPNGCFAMGYYFELGIGGRQDRDQAKKWYQRAAKLNNPDAIQRLAALSAPQPQQMTLSEHQSRLNDTLVRRHTQAKIRSDYLSTRRAPPRDSSRAQAKLDTARLDDARNSMSGPPSPRPYSMGGAGVSSPNPNMGRSPGLPASQSMPRTPALNGYAPPAPPRSPQPGPPLSPQPGQGPRTRPQIGVSIPPSPSFQQQQQHQHQQQQGRIRPSASSPNPQIVTTPPSLGPSARQKQAQAHAQQMQSGPISPPASSMPAPAPQRGYILQDSLVPALPPPESFPGDPGPRKKGPQTFAEMGFVSKPVQDEGCVIM